MDARIRLEQRLVQIARSVPEFSFSRESSRDPGEGPGELSLSIRCGGEVWRALAEAIGTGPEVETAVELENHLLGLALTDGSTAVLRHEDFGAMAPAPTAASPDQQAARFWFSLIRLCTHLETGHPFSAHACLETARIALVDLYRTALAPGAAGTGWAGLEALPGAEALDALGEWLVCPLELQAQWRCGVRLAQTYERLTLGVFERLELPYPWRLRNLAFSGLDRARPTSRATSEGGRGPEVSARGKEEPEAGQGKGPARFRVKGSSIRPQ